MIINFKLKNWGPYKSWETLDFTKKSKEKSGDGFIRKFKNIRDLDILKAVCLVGVNGSGKSYLLEGLDCMKAMVLNSHTHNINTNIRYFPFSSDQSKPTEFEINFIAENKKYRYGFSYTNKKVIKEFLDIYSSQKPTRIFSRDEENLKSRFNIADKYKSELKPISYNVISQTLMVSRASQLNSKTLKPVFDFFNKIFNVQSSLSSGHFDFSLLKSKKQKEELLEKLSFADFSIHGLELVKEKIGELSLELNLTTMSEIRKDLKETHIDSLILIHKHDKKNIKVKFNSESVGTQKFILFFYNLLTLPKNSVILFDEIENSLNIEIVEFIIDHFSSSKNKFQLLFTTHQPNTLNLLRSDQINIIEKKDSVSKIVNLHTIVKNNSKINKNYGDYYGEGVLGGFPNVYKES